MVSRLRRAAAPSSNNIVYEDTATATTIATTEVIMPTTKKNENKRNTSNSPRKMIRKFLTFRKPDTNNNNGERTDTSAGRDGLTVTASTESSEFTGANSLKHQTRIISTSTVSDNKTPAASAAANAATSRQKESQLKQSTPQSSPEMNTNSTLCSPNFHFTGVCVGGNRPHNIEDDVDNDQEEKSTSSFQLPDDPTVQESIECFLAATHFQDQFDSLMESSSDDSSTMQNLATPSSLQQCLLKNRSSMRLPLHFQQAALLHTPPHEIQYPPDRIETIDSSALAEAQAQKEATQPICTCRSRIRPLTEPEQWPQRPLLMRPTPHGGTVVKGVRFAGNTEEYLWKAQSSPLTWPQALHAHWNKNSDNSKTNNRNDTTSDHHLQQMMMCPHCMILPINNGNELPGESLVTDFESEFFDGTILVRLKDSKGTTCKGHEKLEGGYFDNLHRRYQVVIRGKFKKSIPWTECFAGFQLERPAGKLPPKWIVNGALNVVKFFAPQIQTRMHGQRPYSLTPLGSTPQSLIVQDEELGKRDARLEIPQEEPTDAKYTLLGKASTVSSTMQRARYRKKLFDKLYAQQSMTPVTDTNKVYTFEFLQHLLSFDDFTIELGSMLGSIPLKGILDGQPMQIMASHKHPCEPTARFQNKLWCFDIWHEMLIPDAIRYEEDSNSNNNNNSFNKNILRKIP